MAPGHQSTLAPVNGMIFDNLASSTLIFRHSCPVVAGNRAGSGAATTAVVHRHGAPNIMIARISPPRCGRLWHWLFAPGKSTRRARRQQFQAKTAPAGGPE